MFIQYIKHLECLDPQIKNTKSTLTTNNVRAENLNKLNIELINNLNQIKSHPQQKLNDKD